LRRPEPEGFEFSGAAPKEVAVPEPTEVVGLAGADSPPQGRKGEVFAEILTDFPDKFAERRQVWLLAADVAAAAAAQAPRQRQVELMNHWLHKGGVVLHFAGVDSITAAEAAEGTGCGDSARGAGGSRRRRSLRRRPDRLCAGGCGRRGGSCTWARSRTWTAAGALRRCSWCAARRAKCWFRLRRAICAAIDLAAKRVEMALPVGLVDLSQAEEA
jgi:16S rRNA processing protein RimM